MGIFDSIGRGFAAAGRGIARANTAAEGVFRDPIKSQPFLDLASALTTSEVPTAASQLAASAQKMNRQQVFSGALAEEDEAQRNKTAGVSSAFRSALTPEERVQFEQMRKTRLFEPLELEKARTDIGQGKAASRLNEASASNLRSIMTERAAFLELEKKIKEATASQLNAITNKTGIDANEIQARLDRMKKFEGTELEAMGTQIRYYDALAQKALSEAHGIMDPSQRQLSLTRASSYIYDKGTIIGKMLGQKMQTTLVTDPVTGQQMHKEILGDPEMGKRLELFNNRMMDAYIRAGYNPEVYIKTNFADVFNSKVDIDSIKIDIPLFNPSNQPNVFTPPASEDSTGTAKKDSVFTPPQYEPIDLNQFANPKR